MLCSYPEASVLSSVIYREPRCFLQDSVFHLDPSMNLAFGFLCLSAKNNPSCEMHWVQRRINIIIWKGHSVSKIVLYEHIMPEHKVILIHFLVMRSTSYLGFLTAVALRSVWQQVWEQGPPILTEEEHFSSEPIFVSIHINLFQIRVLILQPIHQKENTVTNYLIQEALLAAIKVISLGFGKPAPCNGMTMWRNKNKLPYKFLSLSCLSKCFWHAWNLWFYLVIIWCS